MEMSARMRRALKFVEIHTAAEIEAEVKRLRPEIARLIEQGMVRVWCLEEDLRTLAYNHLSERKL
jgi:hypothetical protein